MKNEKPYRGRSDATEETQKSVNGLMFGAYKEHKARKELQTMSNISNRDWQDH